MNADDQWRDVNADEQMMAEILEAATHSDVLWLESWSSRRQRSSRGRALRKAGDPEARVNRQRIIQGGLAAMLGSAIERFVRAQVAADSSWTWKAVPLDVQVALLRELFREAGLLARFRWDLTHDFPLF